MKLLRIIFIALSFSALPLYTMSLNWVIVTSENDNPGATNPANPQTLRDAIEAVNGDAGTDAPNAIAFANNVQTIALQANLPLITPVTNVVLIDGLAIANLANPQNTVEGDCSLLPSPVDDPQGFSESIRVTIDGSTIADSVDPTERHGLAVATGSAIIRGIRIQNITAPGNGSQAQGIILSDIGNSTECCEIDHIQNTAYTTDNNGNRTVGIECDRPLTRSQCGTSVNAIVKCYIHDIEGGSIANCDGTLEALQSGHAFGILNCECIEQCRIEAVTSGSINALCNNNLRAVVGRSAGIANGISNPGSPPPWPCGEESLEQKTGVENCPIDCDQNCQNNPICIRDNAVCTINGGSVITSQPELFVLETAGMLLGSPFSSSDFVNVNSLVQNNIVACIRSGDSTASGNNTRSIAWGAFGIVVSDPLADTTITCNTIDTIQTGSTTLTGELSIALPGYTIGIWNEKKSQNNSLIQCNAIRNICGTTAFAHNTCDILSDDINTVCQTPIGTEEFQIAATKHVPGGALCAPIPAPVVAGIRAENVSSVAAELTVSNNTVHTILGGKRVAQGASSIVTAIGSIGIYINAGTSSSSVIVANQNNIQSVAGAELIAQPGSAGALKTQGTSGLCAISQTVTATENQVVSICEGPIRAAQNTLGINLTQVFFGFLNKLQPTKQHLEEDNATPYAPVITSGIVISSPEQRFEISRACTNQDPWCIADNVVNTVIGSFVTGSIPPLGSIAVGIWLQPTTGSILATRTKTMRSFESCVDARQNNTTNGTAFNNKIHAITAGTCAPAYGIFLDGSAQFFTPFVLAELKTSTLFTLENNTINTVCGDKTFPSFEAPISTIAGLCLTSFGSLDTTSIFFPFLPFEPTSGIYALFGGCSTISNNTIKTVKASRSKARGITTAASSDMLIFENICSDIKGYGIFVGGAIATIDLVEGLGSEGLEAFASVRNKIHTNSTVDNTDEGIRLGLVDWSNALFGIELLNVCPAETFLQAIKSHQDDIVPEDSVAIFGNHGQPAPEIIKVVCNSNGTITIEIDLQNTHPLTNFIIQFFRNSTNTVLHGEQAISDFDNPLFVFTTDFNGRAIKRFTFVPLAEIQTGDNITAHVTVSSQGQAAITDTFFCDTSEFGGQAAGAPCPPTILGNRPHNKPSLAPGFATLLHR